MRATTPCTSPMASRSRGSAPTAAATRCSSTCCARSSRRARGAGVEWGVRLGCLCACARTRRGGKRRAAAAAAGVVCSRCSRPLLPAPAPPAGARPHPALHEPRREPVLPGRRARPGAAAHHLRAGRRGRVGGLDGGGGAACAVAGGRKGPLLPLPRPKLASGPCCPALRDCCERHACAPCRCWRRARASTSTPPAWPDAHQQPQHQQPQHLNPRRRCWRRARA